MDFKKLQLTDKDAIRLKMGYKHDFLGWEYDFSDLFLWDVYNVSQIYQNDDFCIVHTVVDSKDIFYPPYMKRQSDFLKAVSMIYAYCKSCGMEQFTIIGLTKEQACQLDAKKYFVTTDEGLYDYIYSAESLIHLSGKKFHAKRNFVTKFTTNYDYEITEYTADDYDGVMELVDEWKTMHDETNATLLRERQAIKRALEHYRELDLKICEIKVASKPVAFSVSSLYNEKVGHTIFEKASIQYEGAFQAINKFTAQKFFQGCACINREEDLNIEGLRRAKKSYNPILLWEKHNAVCNL